MSIKKIILSVIMLLFILILIGSCGDDESAVTFSVTYNGNGNFSGSVPVDNILYTEGSSVTVLSNSGNLNKIPVQGTAEAFKFVGWNTKADGTGTQYSANGITTFSIETNNVILYAEWSAYILRDIGPAGGLIFYDKGSFSDGWRYMEVAPVSQDTNYFWSNIYTNAVGAANFLIGEGLTNTKLIINQPYHTNGAAKLCDDYSLLNNGITYDDWYLPSFNELDIVRTNLQAYGLGGFITNADYWSSTEYNFGRAYVVEFDNNGGSGDPTKDNLRRVRAVRRF